MIGNQRVIGNFKLYVMFNNSNDWTLWKAFNDLEDCYSERFVIPNLYDSKIVEVASDGSTEEISFIWISDEENSRHLVQHKYNYHIKSWLWKLAHYL